MLELCAWPRLWVGRLAFQGADEWQAALPRLVPAERQILTRRLAWPLARATNPARFKAWCSGTRRRKRETFTDRCARIRETVAFYGDAQILEPVTVGLASLPTPVSDTAVKECMFLATGRSTSGWIGGVLPPWRRPILLAGHYSDAHIRKTTAHESSHAWLTSTEQEPFALRTAREDGLAQASDTGDNEREAKKTEEALVRILTTAWLSAAGPRP
jgi:hypothetical protein